MCARRAGRRSTPVAAIITIFTSIWRYTLHNRPRGVVRTRLIGHQDCRRGAVSRIEVDVTRLSKSALVTRYLLTGSVGDLRLPPPSGVSWADGLWRHTCFELFLRGLNQEAYYEFNFAPSLQWAAWCFDGYRRGMHAMQGFPTPQIEIRQTGSFLELNAVLELDGLTDLNGNVEWRLGLSAVTEETDGALSHWALVHGPGKPDFHHYNAFALSLAAHSA